MNKFRPFFLLLLTGMLLLACVPAVQTPPPDSGAAQPAADQTLILASGRDLGPGNPHAYDSSMVLLDLIYEPLVRYAPDGTIAPALAESWEISDDGLTWTFHLRQGVTFHDGTPFDAEAARWNLARWVGVERHNWLPTTDLITDVAAPDAATLVITLASAYYPSIQDLALIRPVRFLSPAGVDANGEFAQPIGTGPWQVETLTNEAATLTRYEAYWGEKPTLDRLDIELVSDAQTRVAALLSGDLDVIGGEYMGTIAPESLATLEQSDEVTVFTGAGTVSYFVATNYDVAPLSDRRVRAAINHALDRQGMVDAIFGGRAQVAEGVLSSVIPYVTTTDVGAYTYDPAQARALLAEAGWTLNSDGVLEQDGQPLALELVVDQTSLPQMSSMATAIQAQLKEVGIAITLRMYDYSGWLDAYYADDFDLLMSYSWGTPYDPHTLLKGSFHSGRGEETNVSYTSAELDELIDAALASTDATERQALYDQIWQHLDEQAAVIPLIYPERVYAVRNEVQGFRLGGTEYNLSYAVQEVTVAK